MTVTTLLQGFSSQAAFTSLLLLSSKGENPAQSKSDSIAGKKVFFSSSPFFLLLLLFPPASPFRRRGTMVDCKHRRLSHFLFSFKISLISPQITSDQDQVPQRFMAAV